MSEFGPGAASPAPYTGEVLGEVMYDMTGYAIQSTSAASGVLVGRRGLTFTAPASGWVRVTLISSNWVNTAGIVEQWQIYGTPAGGTQGVVPRSQLVAGSGTAPASNIVQFLTCYANNNQKLVPGQQVTYSWGWLVTNGSGTVNLDNGLSIMRVEAASAPQWAGSNVVTVENVATVSGATGSQTLSWANVPKAGDLLLALFSVNVAGASFVGPSGWGVAQIAELGSNALRVALLYKVAGGSEPQSVTFTGTGGTLSALHLWSKRGFASTPTLDQSSGSGEDNYGSNLMLTAANPLTNVPEYGVGFTATAGAGQVTQIGNGWGPAVVYNGATTLIFQDPAGGSVAMAVADKILSETGLNPQIAPTVSAVASTGWGLSIFTGA